MAHLPLSDTGDWQLDSDAQDIRGLAVIDADGVRLGRVEQLIVDTATETISTVLLDDGTGIPVADLTLGDGVVHVSRHATDVTPHTGKTTDTDAENDPRTTAYTARLVRRSV